MRWTTTPAPTPGDPADLAGPEAWGVHGAAAVSHAVDLDHWGHTDVSCTARYLATRLREQTYAARTWLVATAARVRTYEQGIRDAGHGYVVIAAIHRQSAELAGLTMVEYDLERAAPLFQEDTLVLRAHRGHRLGLLIKCEMIRLLATTRPGARRVHTWNAEENAHMLAINVALGFRPARVAGLWQRKLY